MKKILIILYICILTFAPFLNSSANAFSLFHKKSQSEPIEQQDFTEVELDVNEEEKLKIEKTEPAKKIEAVELTQAEQEQIKAFEIQRKQDVEDITSLWQATVERNNVIKFALTKVTMNPEERKKHSSKMARSISALINGATLLPYLFGLDATIASAAAAGTSLATQATKNKLGYGSTNIPVTDTELIQLASLIEDLQNSLIKNYYAYKSSIELLKDCRSKLAVYERNHKQALNKKDTASILVTKTMYEKQQIEELKLKNKIKSAKIELERFAGEEVVNNLNLAQKKHVQANSFIGGEL